MVRAFPAHCPPTCSTQGVAFMRTATGFARLLLLVAALIALSSTAFRSEGASSWAAPMRDVRARFTGTPGTLALFGDSITLSLAFWAPLRGEPKGMSYPMAAAHALVKEYLRPEC